MLLHTQFLAKIPPEAPVHLFKGIQSSSTRRIPTVVVVDDERLIADTLVEILNDSGFNAVAVYDGKSALDLVQELCPDTLISDVIMPQMDGIEVAKAVKEMCIGTRVLLLSGQAATNDLVERARQQGHSFEVLAKPIDPEVLLKKLREQ